MRKSWHAIHFAPAGRGFPSVRGRHLAGIAALALLGAGAQSEVRAQGWGGALGIASDNIDRGYSLSAGRPAWLADLHYEFGPEWLIGLSASAERPRRQEPGARLAVYIDRRWRVDDVWAAKAGVVHYDSPWNAWRRPLRYDEINVAIGYRDRWRATLAVSPNTPERYLYPYRRARSGFAAWPELTFHQPIVGRLSADIGVGYAYRQHAGDRNYGYGNVGISYAIGDTYLYLSRLWTNSVAPPYGWNGYSLESESRGRWVASVVWSF
ncbi:hypothetical protein [Dokdonella soli]|uniref:Uncharacterized protein n=1 Tax=Dokdonella soli TaxID=529810 RepID=A0ABN1IEQ1_9GAMM